MIQRILNLSLFLVLAILSWFLDFRYGNVYFQKFFTTFAALSGLYLLLKILLEEWLVSKIKDPKERYSLRQTVSAIHTFVFLLVLVGIWIENLQALMVAYGLIAAGVAISLQDLFKNIAGGITLFIKRLYTVGDRIEMNGKFGDVVDVSLLYTTLMEMKEWVDGDQATGRLTIIPNGAVLSQAVNNYTKDHEFIWDEIRIPLTYESDWKKAQGIMREILLKETKAMVSDAERALANLQEKYYISKRETQPFIFVRITDNWIEFTLRYVVDARKRRIVHANINETILNALEKEKGIAIASATLTVRGHQEVKLKK